jgi:hypothetical protein
MTFNAFAKLIAATFQDMAKGEVFVADIDGDALWDRYLLAFPEGTNPIFRVRTEHDCSTCRQFIKRAGNVVTITDGQVRTVWDRAAEYAPAPYAAVASYLSDSLRGVGIRDLFRVGKNEIYFGAPQTRSLDKVTRRAETWDHLYTGEIPSRFRVALPDTDKGAYRTAVQVFERGLEELSSDAVDTVLGLIDANALYRGEEHRPAVVAFRRMQREYRSLQNFSAVEQHSFVWAHAGSPAARFRNTVIGTLVQDLSEGKSLELAVKAFETKVAPQNYKRTTALITPGMVKKAMETITELGLEPALERRFATIADVSVTDVLWVDGTARPLMKGGIGELLAKHVAVAAPSEERATDIALGRFMETVLPEAQSVEVFFTGAHLGNLMALTAPAHPEPARLFRWDNDFSWSYSGNVADSIKERVKKAGGNVGGVLRVSLSWGNFDDLDIHVYEPSTRGVRGLQDHIFFGNKAGWTGGLLDVDMNAGSGRTREPVENVVWAGPPPDGLYRIVVNNYCQRETSDPGFVVEVESGGKVSHFSYAKQLRTGQEVGVLGLHMKNGAIERIEAGDPSITSAMISQEKWGLTTERFVKVSAVMLSPNHWGKNEVGNKHHFFVLDGCKSDEDMRGFYNEFLHPRLEQHRKVFEVIADKTKCRTVDGGLAGLGFSSTKRDTFMVRVTQGARRRTFNVNV